MVRATAPWTSGRPGVSARRACRDNRGRFVTRRAVTPVIDRDTPAQMGATATMIGTEAISRVIGKDVYDQSGDRIGSASEVYLDDESGQPEWVTVRTGLFGTKESFVPIRDADLTDRSEEHTSELHS